MSFDRKSHWENVYRTRSPLDVSWYQEEPAMSLQLIEATGVARDAPLIDVGGGASVLVDRLCAAGHSRLAVLDISTKALDYARARLGRHADSIEWFAGDVTRFDPPHRFALWHDRAVFHFLTVEAERKRYVEVLKQALQPGGHLIIAAFAIGGPQQCSGLDIVQYDRARLLAELGDEFVLIEERDELHLTPAKRHQEFGYFRLQRR